jgi:hypothetical protein
MSGAFSAIFQKEIVVEILRHQLMVAQKPARLPMRGLRD